MWRFTNDGLVVAKISLYSPLRFWKTKCATPLRSFSFNDSIIIAFAPAMSRFCVRSAITAIRVAVLSDITIKFFICCKIFYYTLYFFLIPISGLFPTFKFVPLFKGCDAVPAKTCHLVACCDFPDAPTASTSTQLIFPFVCHILNFFCYYKGNNKLLFRQIILIYFYYFSIIFYYFIV